MCRREGEKGKEGEGERERERGRGREETVKELRGKEGGVVIQRQLLYRVYAYMYEHVHNVYVQYTCACTCVYY